MNRTLHEIEPEEVMAYLDGELEAARASEVAAHIADCAECHAVEIDLRAVSERLQSWSVESATIVFEKLSDPAGTQVRVPKHRSRGLFAVARRMWTSPLPWRLALAGAALFMLAVFSLPNLMRGREAATRVSNFLAMRKPALPAASLTADTSAEEQFRSTEDMTSNLERSPSPAPPIAPAPMIARTAAMTLVVAKLNASRGELEKLLARHHAFASQMTLDKSNDTSPSLDATLQVPSGELDALLGELRGLGRVTAETLGGEDVSDQHVDLAARLHNARETETRLLEILRTRTGKVSDVLEVEQQISQTRGEIEQMEAQLANLDKRVSYASIKLQMAEEYKAPAAANGSVILRLRNAVVSGYRDAADSLIALAVFLLSAGPTLLIWAFILFWPARALWKRRRALRTAFGKS